MNVMPEVFSGATHHMLSAFAHLAVSFLLYELLDGYRLTSESGLEPDQITSELTSECFIVEIILVIFSLN